MDHSQPKEFHHPQGFLSLAKNVGIKDRTLDLTVIYSTVRARAAAMFTRNRFPGAPVIVGRKHIADGFAQALVINSKNANVAMGKVGIDNAIETCRIVAKELGVDSYDVLPFSTGVIGRPLPMDKIRAGLRGIKSELKPDNLKLAAEAIMTTDMYPKYVSVKVGNAIIAGIAKGAGMIEPNMATMLVYLMTDAELPKTALRPMLRRVVDRTFNCMSIDTDTSTSDTVVLMANGLAGKVKLRQFEKGLLEVCEYLTKEIARNGEGATKLIAVDVARAKTQTASESRRQVHRQFAAGENRRLWLRPQLGPGHHGCRQVLRCQHRAGQSYDSLRRHQRFQKGRAGGLRSRCATEISRAA